jgi:hypothetical protein
VVKHLDYAQNHLNERNGLVSSFQRLSVPFWITISRVEGECLRGWAELRKLRQRVLTIVLAGGGSLRVCDLTDSFYQVE